jgi:general secretion pathway protein N
MTPRYMITTVLGLLLVAALAIIGWETDWGRAIGGSSGYASANKRASLDTKVLPQFALAPLSPLGSGYSETVERPLFIPTRRPAPAGNTTQMAMKKGQFRLAGTTVSEQISVAYLFETGTNKTLRVNKGAAVNGITVESVSANRVVLKQGDETEELFLRTSNSPKPPPPPPVAAAPGQPGGQAPGQAPGAPANVAQGGQGPVPSQMPAFTPPGVNPQAGYPPGAAMTAPPLPPGTSTGGPQIPGGQNPNTNSPTDPAATPAGVDPNNPAARRRRFQNLPQ